jgi:hypothetical protein
MCIDDIGFDLPNTEQLEDLKLNRCCLMSSYKSATLGARPRQNSEGQEKPRVSHWRHGH